MTTPRDEATELTRSLRLALTLEREAGVVDLPGTPTPAAPAAPPAPPRVPAEPARLPPPRKAPRFTPRVGPLDLPADALAPFGEVPATVASCTKCPLCESRTLTVFGEGDPAADLVFCGEAPGYEEDRSGRPFVGRSGELLTRMIEGGLRMRREDVFIMNTLKCRPPNNRTPTLTEIAACREYLEAQLQVIAPKVIVALGNPAARTLLGPIPGITRVHGQVFEAHGAHVVPSYHPAYLLRNPSAKRESWEDLKVVLGLLAGD